MAAVDEGDAGRGGAADTGRTSRQPIVSVRGLSKRYEGVQALEDVSLDVYDNEVLALVGDNGAGKSTLVKCLCGVTQPTAGTIHVRNDAGEMIERNVDDPSDAQEFGIETVFQNLALSGQHDVAQNVFMGREPREDGFAGKWLRRVDREQMNRRTNEALNEIGFAVDPTAPTAELSGGQQQATAVARALITDPSIVLLDEPTAEVSVEGSEKILELVDLLQDQGRTVVFISHNLEEVFEVADRVAVLRDGKLVGAYDNEGSLTREDLVGLMTGAIDSLDQHGEVKKETEEMTADDTADEEGADAASTDDTASDSAVPNAADEGSDEP